MDTSLNITCASPSARIKLLVAVVVAILLSSCGTAPTRDPYTGADQVGAVDSAKIIGTWKMSVLNPIGDENDNQVTFTFQDGGEWQSTYVPSAQQNADLGAMEFVGQGVWRVEGDKVFTQAESIDEVTGNKLGGLMKAVTSAFLSKSAGYVNPYEMSVNRIIWVHDESGQASLLERL